MSAGISIFSQNALEQMDNDKVRLWRRKLATFLQNGLNISIRKGSRTENNSIIAFKEENDEFIPLNIEDLMDIVVQEIDNQFNPNGELYVSKADIYEALGFINSFVDIEFNNGEWK